MCSALRIMTVGGNKHCLSLSLWKERIRKQPKWIAQQLWQRRRDDGKEFIEQEQEKCKQ